MQQSNINHCITTGHKILKKPITEKPIKGKNIMLYPIETTTWKTEIHSMAFQQKWKRLAAQERMLRAAKKNKKTQKPNLNRILERMHIFLTLSF